MSDFHVDRGGFRLAASVHGAKGAPWLVLSNSLGATRAMWADQVALFSKTHRVLTYDTRGHGASDAPPGPYSFHDLVDDVLALMDHAEARTASFVGLSLGGMTGLGLGLDHPSRLEKLVCCDARADAPPAFVTGWDDRLAAIENGGLAAILQGTMERWFVERWRAAHPDRLARFEADFLATSLTGYHGCVAALKSLDFLPRLPEMSVPTLFVVGEKDMGAPPAVMRAMADATPGARFAEIPDAAHLPNIDSRDAFDRVVGEFLRG